MSCKVLSWSVWFSSSPIVPVPFGMLMVVFGGERPGQWHWNRYLDKKNKVSSYVVLVVVALHCKHVACCCAWYWEMEFACEMIQDVSTTWYCLRGIVDVRGIHWCIVVLFEWHCSRWCCWWLNKFQLQTIVTCTWWDLRDRTRSNAERIDTWIEILNAFTTNRWFNYNVIHPNRDTWEVKVRQSIKVRRRRLSLSTEL